MFTGEYHHTIDEKNRLAIPSDIRDKVNTKIEGKGFFITIGLDGCLFMYTPKEWQNIVQKINQLPFTNEKARQFQRLFFSKAQEIPDYDPQGRILISQNLKDIAKIQKKAVIVGVSSRIEIWDETRWKNFESEHSKEYEKIAEDLFK
ncbi:MAG TPA: division/cell wall cluster transcriptional repressor MraZ [Candidatus Wujingus californicus]|uniref:division/cell wall cluster transcriptional repressor MraZ n=1 Tax=Candidatus Wujingus californicus TaxID=3367618 RepID=UPI001E16D74C|nr:division/cell wall cluster transcriptional repressor MraZ [Planctomycetota bacterium]MDO8130455.1 division/cell wall cluster transcriptional repressor MraZ [Candidatus Brocadiales bacterium]